MKRRRWLRWLVILVTLVMAISGVGLGFIWWWLPGSHVVDRDIELPTRFTAGLIYAEPVTIGGEKMSLLADTGGGTFVTRRCAARCGMRADLAFGGRSQLPAFRLEAWIPEPTGGEKWIPLTDGEGDGMLGQRWFAGGVWTFDYSAAKLILRQRQFVPTDAMARHAVALGFRREFGVRTSNHPRFLVVIAGEPVESLLDTGATVWPSPEALHAMGDQAPGEQATSFVSADLFSQWRTAHPEWRVINEGCERSREALIEVPEVQVAGLRAGPVWFTRRGTANYAWMSSFMDRPIAASIGGNILMHFRVTVDYTTAVAYWEDGE
ncbi:MAG TPA: hypothetical protein VI136_00235 [Verrucomicrobiae bacterium]